MKPTEYKAEDYTWSIRPDVEPNPNTGKFDRILFIHEFDVEYSFDTSAEAEASVLKIIESLMKTRVEDQKLPLPIPLKYMKKFSGNFNIRISPETHRKLYIESQMKEVSLNQLIESKLA